MTLAAVRRGWRDGTIFPYLMLLVSPVVMLPISGLILRGLPDCGEDEPWWELGDFELALLPQLADFAPFLWVLSRTPAVRGASVIAGLIGSVRYVIPQVFTLVASASSSGQELNANCTISSFLVLGLGPIMLGLWLASAVVVGLVVTRGSSPEVPRDG